MPINTQVFGNAQAHSEIDQRDTGSTTHQPATRIRAEEVTKYLKGARFPANKNDLVEHAIEQQAPSRIVDALRQIPTPEFGNGNATKLTVYNSIDELTHEIDRVG